VSYLVDTNVLSELRQRAPDRRVVQWFTQRPATTLYLSVLTVGEVRKDIEGLAAEANRGQFTYFRAAK
jgi:predicted nucleic acid-binding protein